MKIKTKFNIGDKVWVIVFEKKDIGCDICNTKGEIKIKGRSFTCPNCDGTKHFYVHNYFIKGVYEIIGHYIYFETKNSEKIENIKYYIPIDDSDKIFGSDNFFGVNETNCFTTKVEAQKECNRRNKY